MNGRVDKIRILKGSVIALGTLLGVSLLLLVVLLFRSPAPQSPSTIAPAYTRQPDPLAVSLPNPTHDRFPQVTQHVLSDADLSQTDIRLDGEVYEAGLWGIRTIKLPSGTKLGEKNPQELILPNGTRLTWSFQVLLQDVPLYSAQDVDPVVSSLADPAGLQAVETVERADKMTAFRAYRAKQIGGKQIYALDAPGGGVYLFIAQPAVNQTPESVDQQIRPILTSLQMTDRRVGPKLVEDPGVGIDFFAEPGWSLQRAGADTTVYENPYGPVRWVMKRLERKTNSPESLGILHEYIQAQTENGQIKNLMSTEPKAKKYNGHAFYETEIGFRNPTGTGPHYSILTAFAEGDWTYQMMLFGAGDKSLEPSRKQLELFQKTVRIR